MEGVFLLLLFFFIFILISLKKKKKNSDKLVKYNTLALYLIDNILYTLLTFEVLNPKLRILKRK